MSTALISVILASIFAAGSTPKSRSSVTPTAGESYRRMAEDGNTRAQTTSGELALQNGDLGAAFKWFLEAAEKGDSDAQVKVGDLFFEGRGTLRNPAQAAHWYAMAAGRSAYAQWRLGRLFEEGEGVPRNVGIAAAMFRRSSDQGFAEAQNSLADLHIAGIGVKQDFKEAFKLYRKAAEQNCPDAQLNLAALYYHGIGVKKDYSAARMWAERARATKAKEADEMLARIDKARAASSN
jgi:TPR repeat protein